MKKIILSPYILVILAMLFWGMSYVWVKIVYQYIGPLSTVFLRISLATIILLSFGLLFKKQLFASKKDLPAFLLLALFEPFAYFLGESYGLQLVSSSIGSIMIGTIPLFIPFFAFFILKDRISIFNIVGLLISFAGLLVLILNKDFTFDASPLGILLMLVAVLSGALYTIQLKKLSGKYSSFTILFLMNFIGLIYFIPLFLVFELKELIQTNIDIRFLSALFQLVIFASIGAMLLYIQVVERIGVTKASVFTNLIPIITAIGAWVILPDESLNLKLVSGILIVVTGIYIGQKGESKN